MGDDLPNQFDILVVGTGFSESVVAAAASRIGKTVLHIDQNDFYGCQWASFNLDSFEKFLSTAVEKGAESDIEAIKQTWHSSAGAEESETDWTKEKVIENFRKFNIDLCPKLLYARGALVELLISSNIGRYAEFRALDKICTIFDGVVRNVPCSRNDVFNTNDLTIIERRLLMKLLMQTMSYEERPDEYKEFEGKPFLDYLKSQRLTEKIINCVLYSISMCNEDTVLSEGLRRAKQFLQSLERYGNTPFLFPMYGCGELPQCFCRLCAVFGGIYCLKREIEAITPTASGEWQVKVANQDISVGKVVIGSGNMPSKLVESKLRHKTDGAQDCGQISRAIFITSQPIGSDELNTGGGGVNLMRLPGTHNRSNGAFVIQLSHYSGTCPKGLYLIHITTESFVDDPEEDIKPYSSQIFADGHKLLYSTYFRIPKCKGCQFSLEGTNIYTTCGPFYELDYELSLKNAKNIFETVFPNEEFLPRAPDPEEIIIGDEDPEALCEANLAEDLRTQMELDDVKDLEECQQKPDKEIVH